jgi:hypothetical protein
MEKEEDGRNWGLQEGSDWALKGEGEDLFGLVNEGTKDGTGIGSIAFRKSDKHDVLLTVSGDRRKAVGC